MKAKFKEIVFVFTVLIWVFTPTFVTFYERKEQREEFYRILNEDYETCRRRAKEDTRETEWCSQIDRSAKLAFRSARGNELLLILMWGPLLVFLFVYIYSLKKQIEELKQKDNA